MTEALKLTCAKPYLCSTSMNPYEAASMEHVAPTIEEVAPAAAPADGPLL